MRLRYKAITRDNKIIRGLVDAKEINEAAIYLRSKNLVPITIAQEAKNSILNNLPFLGKIKGSDLILFTRQLSSMLSSGLTLIRSLEILKEQFTNEAMLEDVSSIITDIEEGKTFSFAISKFPDVFSPIYVSIIKSAESSGLLDRALLRLSDNLEKEEKLKGTIKAALFYPAIVVALMAVVVFIMMTFVIPQLANLYKGLNVELPLPTKIIISVSGFFVVFWPLVIGLAALSIFLYRRWYKTEAGRLIIDNLIFKIPVFGNLIKKVILTELARTLGVLVGSGSLVVDSLIQTSETLGNVHYRNAVKDVAKKVENGVTIGDAMSSYSLFPPLLVQLVKIGEQTGKLDETLLKASEYFEGEAEQLVKTLTTALEPLIIVTLGVGVAFLMISVITPIYSLISFIK
ncbi:MAG: type II secretion system F family protein [Patescibacteria group bacterium]